MSSLALYAESVYRHAPSLRGKNLLADIETDFNAGVSPEDSASFLSSLLHRGDLVKLPIPIPSSNKIHLDNPAALAAHVLQTYGKTKAIDLVLKETWRNERGSTMFKFYAAVLRNLVGGGV